MPNSWRLLTDDARERDDFADLATTLAHPSEPAAEPNRLRHVMRLTIEHRRYYLKTFQSTQWKNRVHFACTKPRASDDAERELRVTQALRAQGFGAPRPIAYGRDGATSYYLCAELAGEPLADRLRTGRVTHALTRAVAMHCGELLARGFALIDLSADHVFVHEANDQPALAVLDLHNAGLRKPGTPSRKLLRRVLRRFARSVRELGVARTTAMRFAARLLRSAEVVPGQRRALITAAQPFGTAARYEQSGRSAVYAERNPRRAKRERELLTRVWPGKPNERVLDAPCGTGRLLPFLREHQHRVAQLDGALAMARQAHATGNRGEMLVQGDALQLPFADRALDGCVMFRFLHHLPADVARAAIAEACRVADRFVVFSFFHPCSVHHLRRRLSQLSGTPSTRFAMTLATVRSIAARHGFDLHARAAQMPFARDLWLASFVRR